MNSTTIMVDMTEELVSRLKPAPFQRKLNKSRLPHIVEQLANGIFATPIVIAKIGKDEFVLDGQHRLEAWKLQHFPLKAAMVEYDSMASAAKNFIEINRTARRVSLLHRLNVDPGKYATNIRKIGDRYKCSASQVNAVVCGILGTNWLGGDPFVTREKWALVETVISEWRRDTRWGRKDSKYSAIGTLICVAKMLRNSRNPKRTIDKLKNLDFSAKGTLGNMVGSHGKAVRDVMNYMYKFLAKDIL